MRSVASTVAALLYRHGYDIFKIVPEIHGDLNLPGVIHLSANTSAPILVSRSTMFLKRKNLDGSYTVSNKCTSVSELLAILGYYKIQKSQNSTDEFGNYDLANTVISKVMEGSK